MVTVYVLGLKSTKEQQTQTQAGWDVRVPGNLLTIIDNE